jgi:hypothetical protein
MRIIAGTLAAITSMTAFAVGCKSTNEGNQPTNDEAKTATQPLTEEESTFYRQSCPMFADDVTVALSDTPDGVALTFKTNGDVALLRERAEHMALMYSTHRGRHMQWRQMGYHGRPGMGRRHGMMHGGMGPWPAVDASVEDVERGARITMTPEDPAMLDSLRQRARLHQQRMQSGECWRFGAQSS